MLKKEGKRAWSVRQYESGDDDHLNTLFNKVFGKERALERWKWKFNENPAHPEKVITVGARHGLIVGMYPSILGRWKIGENVRLVSQPVETAIEEWARDGMLLTELFEGYKNRCRALGVAFAYGGPNEAHHKVGKRRLGYADLTRMPILEKELSVRFPFKRYLRGGPLQPIFSRVNAWRYGLSCRESACRKGNDVPVRRLNRFDARVDQLWRVASQSYDIIAVRDSRFLEWRYRPDFYDELVCLAATTHDAVVGYLILTIMTARSARVGVVADVFSLPDDAILDRLFNSATLFCLQSGIDRMRCGALVHTGLYRALVRAGFTVTTRFLNVVYMPFIDVDERMYADSSRWYLTLGDFDFDER